MTVSRGASGASQTLGQVGRCSWSVRCRAQAAGVGMWPLRSEQGDDALGHDGGVAVFWMSHVPRAGTHDTGVAVSPGSLSRICLN